MGTLTHAPLSTPSEHPRHAARGFREASGNIETLAEHHDRRDDLRSRDAQAIARSTGIILVQGRLHQSRGSRDRRICERNGRETPTPYRLRPADEKGRPHNEPGRSPLHDRGARRLPGLKTAHPEQKDRWKSVFARYPIGELYTLFGYSADASGAFPFEIAA